MSLIATDPFPPYSLSAGRQAEIDPLQRAIGRYVDESIARFVLGEWPADDAQFQVFEATLQELGLPRFLAFWQAVLDEMKEVSLELP